MSPAVLDFGTVDSGAVTLSRKIGPYEIVRSLGEGQYGSVHQAVGQVPGRGRQPGRRRVVAIKALKNRADPESAAGLVQEFALLDQVKHRSIVRVFEYLEDEHAVVMEYVHGVTLSVVLETLVQNRDQVFTEAAIEIGCEIADALFQAYTTPGDNGEPLQLVHRDLKPDNVMLTPTGEVKVLDWGLAKVDNVEFRADNADQVKGTLLYMSPEQARGEILDHRSDLFSLGSIMFEMLMREPLYTLDETAESPLDRIIGDIEAGDTADRCEELRTKVPKVGPFISRALRTRPGDRYENGQELLVDLRRTLHRPRGVDLREFCQYFFERYVEIGDAPDPETLGRAEDQVSRLSIEERLRRSMARQDRASQDAPSDAPGERAPRAVRARSGRAAEVRRAPRARPSRPAAPPAAPPSRSGPPPPPSRRGPPPPPAPPRNAPSSLPSQNTGGVDMAGNPPDGGGRKPKRPPVGGGASRASPFAPPQSPPRKTRREIGNRAPDETGMLSMVPLSNDDDEDEVAHDPSATAFFALPPPKAAARGAVPPAASVPPMNLNAPPPAPPRPGGGMAPPPAMPQMGGMPPRPGFGAPQSPPGFGGPMAQGGPPPPAIQGPVASQGGAYGGSGSPFKVNPQTPPPPVNDAKRVTNHMVYVVVLGMFAMIAIAFMAMAFFGPMRNSDPPPASPSPAVASADIGNKPPTKRRPSAAQDTGDVEPEAKPEKPPPSSRRKRSSSSSSSSSRRSGSSAPKAPAAPKGGTLTVKLTDPSVSLSIIVTCPSGFTRKVSFKAGVASVPSVPAESCKVSFKGGSPAVYSGARGGQTLTCSPTGTLPNCR